MANDPLSQDNTEIDPATGQPKKKQAMLQNPNPGTNNGPYPYLNPQTADTQMLQYKPPSQPAQAASVTPTPGYDPLAGNTAVLEKAQKDVLGGNQNAISPMLQTQTEKLLANPTLGYNTDATKNTALSQYDRQKAQAFEALRQQTADVGNTGANLDKLLTQRVGDTLGRNEYENQLNQQNFTTQQDALIKALGEGRAQEKQTADLGTQGIANLATVKGMGSQESSQAFTASQSALDRTQQLLVQANDQQGQKDMATLNDKLQTGQLMTQEDFAASQSALDRLEKVALQKGDIAGQLDVQKQRGEIEALAQAAQQKFQQAERVATQGWQSGERISSQDYDTAKQYIDQQNKVAIQKNDIDTQKYLSSQKNALDLQMQTNDMDQQTKQTYLNAKLAEAKANGDVERQKDIIGFQTTQDLAKIDKTQGFEAAQSAIQDKLKQAMQSNDFVQAEVLQKNQFVMQAKELAKQDEWKQSEIGLQGKQIDLQGRQFDYNTLMDAVKNGAVDASAAVTAVHKAMDKYGITIKKADPSSAATAQFEDMKTRYLQTHPEYKAADGTLNGDGVKSLNDNLNNTFYGENGSYLDADGKLQAVQSYTVDGDLSSGAAIGNVIKVNNPSGAVRNTAYNTSIPNGTYKVEQGPKELGDFLVYVDQKTNKKFLAQKNSQHPDQNTNAFNLFLREHGIGGV